MFFVLDIYPSSYQEWQPGECILGFMDVLHGSIGELQYLGRSATQLSQSGIFFYDHFYQLLDKGNTHGVLKKLGLPAWNTIDWPIPQGVVAESYRAKLFAEVQHSLRPGIAAKICKINICMPITVFVDLFNHLKIKVCKTMLTYKADGTEHIVNFLDDGWDKRTSNSVYCEVVLSLIQLKYILVSSSKAS